MKNKELEWFNSLPSRVRNPLCNAGLKSKDEVISKIKTKTIRPKFARNFGKKAYYQLCENLGMTPLAFSTMCCPKCGSIIHKQ